VIDAADNWWGTIDSTEIESLIIDQSDDSRLPLVEYWPIATEPFDLDEPTPVIEPDQPPALPSSPRLAQNYPNPFNPATTIAFDLPRVSHVRLVVYNVLGRHVAVLVDEWLQAGSHNVVWDGSDAASGIYIYRLTTGSFSSTQKMVLLK
jgi:hypothetical protein